MLQYFLKVLGGTVVVLLIVVGILLYRSSAVLGKTWDIPIRPIEVLEDSATVERGRHLTTAILKCQDCHGEDFGGRDPFAEIGPLARVTAPNLTTGKGGVMDRYRDPALLARTIRHAVKADGKPIVIMPSNAFVRTSDADVAAVIAYLRSLPPVDRVIAPSSVKPLGRMMLAVGMFPIVEAEQTDHSVAPVPDQAPVATAEYGAYLAEIGGCMACHGPLLSGGKIEGGPPGWKPATNLTPKGLPGWTEADFVKAMRTGIRPNGTPIDTIMPWRAAGQMDSTEMRAIWLYLSSLPPKEFGER